MRLLKYFLPLGVLIPLFVTPVSGQTLLRGPGAAALDPMFQKVLAAPNDIELNLAFARKAIELEDFEAAVATLERLLIGRTALPLIRLELGMLYLRLEAPELAEAYFLQVLEADGLDEEAKARAEILLAEARKSNRRNSFGMNISLGVKHSSNAVARPVKADMVEDYEQKELAVPPDEVLAQLLPNADISSNGSLTLFFGRELDGLTDRRLDASLTHYGSVQNDQDDLSSLDISMTSMRLGLTLPVERAGKMPITYGPYLSASMLNTDGVDGFSTSGSVGLMVNAYLSQRNPISYSFDVGEKTHAEKDNDGTLMNIEGKDGGRYNLGLTLGHIHQSGGYTSFGVKLSRSEAEDDFEKTSGGNLSLSYSRTLLNMRTSIGIGYSETKYDDPNPSDVFSFDRHDKDTSANLSLSRTVFGINLSLGTSYIERDSNYPGKKYDDVSASLTFSRSFQ